MADTQQPPTPQRPLFFGEALPFLHAQSNRNGQFALGSLAGRYVLICAIKDIEDPAAVAALAASALYTESDMATHVAITKWAFFPASVAWTAAVVWFVAFTAGILPRRFLLTLTAGFASVIVADLMLPRGMLHDTLGTLRPRHVPGGSVMVTVGSSPHALNIVADALTVVAFGFLCFTVYRVRRLPSRERARDLALMTILLAVATLFDGINEYAAGASLSPLYLTQLSFAG